MSRNIKFITNNVLKINKVLELMKQPMGTNIREISAELSITRRSVFRLLNTIEKKLNIPYVINRNTFGGTASYHLSQAFIKKMSNISLPKLRITFSQAIFIYLLLKNTVLQDDSISSEIDQILKCFET